MGRYVAAVAVAFVLSTSPVHAQETRFLVTTTSAEVHKSPSTASAVIGKAPRGQTFEVIRELGSWVSVSWPDAETGVGYLHVTWGTVSHGGDVQSAGAARRDPDSSAASVQVTQVPTARTTAPAGSLPSHLIGVGARIGTGSTGFAATGRAWTHGPVGIQIEAGQSTFMSAVGSQPLKSLQLAPSVVYSPPKNVVTNEMWVRPYIGAGFNMYRSTLKGTLGVPDDVHTGLGSQVFGGAEFTSARLPQLALSADLRQQWAPAPFDGFEMGGIGFSISAHWYVR
jgi:SH3 domain-containing protein